jgi:hypothetical protein
MARQNFNLSFAGVVDLTLPNGSKTAPQLAWPKVVTANRSIENSSGVSRRIPSGWKPPTAYQFQKVDVAYQRGSCLNQVNASGTLGQLYTGIVGPPDTGGRFNGDAHFNGAINETNAIVDLGLRNTALIAARNKLKDTSINLGVAFAERKQTARLVGDTAIRLTKSIFHLKNGKVRKAMDELGISSRKREPRGSNAPQKWLELQYGWKPLLSDVYGASDALSKHPAEDWRVTAKVTRSREDTYVFTVIPNPNGGSGFDACKCEAKVLRSVLARIDAIPNNAATIALASSGVTNPLLIGWELVPFSFVVDWFLPVGNYLESLDAMLGYTNGWYSSSLYVNATWTDVGLSAIGSGGKQIVNNFTGTKRLVRVDRQIQSGIPLPKLPRFKDPASLGHMANGLALLAQVFGRR